MANRESATSIRYEPRPHWNTSDSTRMKAYDVYVDDVLVGRVERAVESTDRHYGRIRVPGKGRLAWAWRRLDGRSNSPGLYESSRERAVKRMVRA